MLRIRVYQIFQCFIRKLIEDIKRLVFRSNDRLKDDLLTMFDRAMSFVKDSKIEGDYLEFGSYKGSTIIIAFHAAQRRYLSSINFMHLIHLKVCRKSQVWIVKNIKDMIKGNTDVMLILLRKTFLRTALILIEWQLSLVIITNLSPKS